MTRCIVIALLLLAVIVYADVPQLLNVQGMLTDTNGDPVDDGTYSVLFSSTLFPVAAFPFGIPREQFPL